MWVGIVCELAWRPAPYCSACLDLLCAENAVSFPALMNITSISSLIPPFSNTTTSIRVHSKRRSPHTDAASCCAAWSYARDRLHNARPTNVERPISQASIAAQSTRGPCTHPHHPERVQGGNTITTWDDRDSDRPDSKSRRAATSPSALRRVQEHRNHNTGYMPKGLHLKAFGRRKSSGNVLEVESEAPAQQPGSSSFRVLERKDGKPTYGASVTHPERTSGRPFDSPLHALRGKSADQLDLDPSTSVHSPRNNTRPGWPLNDNARGSGGTTNSGSSGYYDSSSASARHSSTSTLPSSVDQDHHYEQPEDVRKVATTGMYRTVAADSDDPPPPPPSFSSRAARAFSFGNRQPKNSKETPPPVPVHMNSRPPTHPQRSQSPSRERAMTTSSYASTAVPTRSELTLTSPDFGDDDFSNMFESLKKDAPALPPPTASASHRTESEPMYPPRALSRNALTSSPNPLQLSTSREDFNASPYSQDSDRLMHSPALSSPNTLDGTAPGPAVGNGITQAFLGGSQSGYSRVPERYNSPGPERASISSYSSIMEDGAGDGKDNGSYPNRQAQIDDEDRWIKRVELQDPPITSPASSKSTAQAIPSASRLGAISPTSNANESLFSGESNGTTPQATRLGARDNAMYDAPPNGSPSRAVLPTVHQRTESGNLKKMTPAQFKALQKSSDGADGEHSEEEDLSDNDYDDEDEHERVKHLASQRRKQEANMSVYRQQMKKVTGGGPSDLPSSGASTIRPFVDRGSGASGGIGIHFGGISGQPPPDAVRGTNRNEEEDEDVPLGILQAHGFPSASRPPTRPDGDSHARRTSMAGSTIAGGGAGQGNLPPFAKRLPADPYFGAGLVNQSTRESLALNNSGASMMGTQPMIPPPPPPQMPQGHPGGLVGVIAGEERAKAARRANPNTAAGAFGTMGQMPLPSNMNMPPMPRANSMGNLAPPSVYAPSGALPMPMIPPHFAQMMPQMQQQPLAGGSNQQVMDMMQMQMQLMQNMLQMQNMHLGGPQTPGTPQQQGGQQRTNDYLDVDFGADRPMSVASQYGPPGPQSQYGRAMTMMNPPTGWAQAPQNGTRPKSSILLQGSTYAPSMHMNGGGPGNGYAPSMAPSERSNVGMPSRYRPVTANGDTSRTQSMVSGFALNAFANQQTSPNFPGTPFNAKEVQIPKPAIRVVDKLKGGPKTQARPVDDEEDDGWADMKKKREEKKRFKWGKKSTTTEPTLDDLYQGLD